MGRSARNIPIRLGEKLKRIRLDLELSQADMLWVIQKTLPLLVQYGLISEPADTADSIFRTSISAYERGKRMPPYNVLLVYADLGKVYLDDLINDMMDLPNGKLPLNEKVAGTRRLFC